MDLLFEKSQQKLQNTDTNFVRDIINKINWAARLLANLGDILGKKAPFNSYKLSKIKANLTFEDTKARNAFSWNPQLVLKAFKVKA